MFHPKDIKNTKDIVAELLVLDEHCVEENIYTEFIIVGGALLIITLESEGMKYRMTSDIDIARIRTNDEVALDKILVSKLQERINTRVEGIIIPDVSELVETEEIEAFHHDLFENIKPYTASEELLVVFKALSDRATDKEDIFESGILDNIDISKTILLIEEYKTFYTFADVPDAHWSEVINELKKRL